MDHPNATKLTFIAAIACCAFVALALTFGMGEWKDAPATASAPSATSTH